MKFRHEYKNMINYSDLIQLRRRLSAIFPHDENAGEDGRYIVKSLYFDNFMDKALREKVDGISKREKFRIRYYGNDTSFIKLEKKSKINGLCNKQSAPLSAEECEKIISGDIGFLMDSDYELLKELYTKMKYQVLRPKCIVMYTRESFVYGPGNVRVTIDTDISGTNAIKDFFNPELKPLRLRNTSVLEVKWDEYLPQIVRDAVQMKTRRSVAFSKYAAVR